MKHFFPFLFLLLALPVVSFAQSSGSDTTHAEFKSLRMHFQSYETTQLSGQLNLQLDIAPQAGQSQVELVSAASSVPHLVQATPNSYAYQPLSTGATTTVSILLNYSAAQLPYYPVRVTATLRTVQEGATALVNHDCYVYFTPYGSAEIWDVADYARLRRS